MFEFLDFDYLSDGEIELVIAEKAEDDELKGYLPAYKYEIRLHNCSDTIGRLDIRIGHNKNTYFGGNIGYEIEEAYRGHHYAAKACRLVRRVAEAHGMDKIIITNNPDNIPSRKTCENIGARLLEIVDLSEDNEMYKLGDRQKCRYEWIMENSKAVFLDLQSTLSEDGLVMNIDEKKDCFDKSIKLDFIKEKQEVFQILSSKKTMVLATSAENRVTARSMSCVVINDKIYFQTDRTFLKYRQIKNNPQVALCIDNIQIEGLASITGHPYSNENKHFIEKFKIDHNGSFLNYSHMENEIVVEVKPVLITLWKYIDGKPLREFLDFTNGKAVRKYYDN